jgi:hypothetical protein
LIQKNRQKKLQKKKQKGDLWSTHIIQMALVIYGNPCLRVKQVKNLTYSINVKNKCFQLRAKRIQSYKNILCKI